MLKKVQGIPLNKIFYTRMTSFDRIHMQYTWYFRWLSQVIIWKMKTINGKKINEKRQLIPKIVPFNLATSPGWHMTIKLQCRLSSECRYGSYQCSNFIEAYWDKQNNCSDSLLKVYRNEDVIFLENIDFPRPFTNA